MATSLTIAQHYVDEFDTSWKEVVQQRPSRLEAYTTHYQVRGKRRTINLKGKNAMRLITAVSGPTIPSTKTQYKRWINTLPYDEAVLYDEFDDAFLGQTVLPTSSEVRSHAYAYNRQKDQIIIDNGLSANLEGETGATTVNLAAANKVGVSFGTANSGLTTAKCIEAKRILMAFEAFEEGYPEHAICGAIRAKQVSDLLNDTEFQNADYNSIKALVEGQPTTWVGINWKRLELLPNLASTNVTRCMIWVMDGIGLGVTEKQTYMDILPAQSHSLQIRTVGRMGATRTEEEKIVEVSCDED